MNRRQYAAQRVLPQPQDVVEASVDGVTARALVMCLVNGDQMDVVHLGDVPDGHRNATVYRADWSPARASLLPEQHRNQITGQHLDFLHHTYLGANDDRLAEAFWDTFESASATLVVAYQVPAEMAAYRTRSAPAGQPRPARRRLRAAPYLLYTAVTLLGVAGCQDTPNNPPIGLVPFTASCDQYGNPVAVHPDTQAAWLAAQHFCQVDGKTLGPGPHNFGLMPSADPS